MNNIIIGLVAILLILFGGYIVFMSPETSEYSDNNAVYTTFTEPETGLQFEYKVEPDGYVLEDVSAFIGEQQDGTEIIKVFRLMNAREKAELEASEGGREGPPTINLMIAKNLKNQSASMWVDEFTQFSNTGLLLGEINRDAVIGGANAVTYRTDGLYVADNVVIAQGGYIYFLSGSFLEENSVIHQDFKKLIDSITFVPTNDQETEGGRIDPRAACESALTYMTFPSGEEADAFIESCVRGEHPEVIDRYIKDLGLDPTRI